MKEPVRGPFGAAIAMPYRGNYEDVPELVRMAHEVPSLSEDYFICHYKHRSSSAMYNYNFMWAKALDDTWMNGAPLDFFAMIHDDVYAPKGWMDVAISEMRRLKVDLVSFCLPIADDRGVTSTAMESGKLYSPNLVTIAEALSKPKTWTHPDLLISSGLWVCNLQSPCFKGTYFRMQDWVETLPDGKHVARVISEDWDFSRQVKANGGKIAASTAVKFYHREPKYHNHYAWGTESDKWLAKQKEAA